MNKILIVDDEVKACELLKRYLQAKGHDAVTAGNGIEALEKLNDGPVDLIITDILMPHMDGFQLCRECKTNEKLRYIPFLFYTATYVSRQDEEFAMNLGAERFLVKPIDLDKLLKILETTIKESANTTPVTLNNPVKEEEDYLAGYSKRLVTKLEKKVLDLENEIKLRKKMEVDIIKAQKLESLSTLAGGIAHDFNNFLTIVLFNVMSAKGCTNPTEEIFGYLAYIEKASTDATHLTKQLGSFAKCGEPVKENISISLLIRESASLALSGSKINCEFYLSDDLWLIDADKGQMKQVINNIVFNAKQAMPEGGIITIMAENIDVSIEDALPLNDGKYVKVIAKDEGTGIPHEFLQKVFDPYFTTKDKGSGLGLAISDTIIRKHEGHISVESETGAGTAFTIYLPVSLEQKREAAIHL
ncbi:MAG: response regulator [Candidatus Scalindua sp.]|jgi:signal transduction histidine kinase|nr:response regulator [Candidatus Scalindua sp.]